MPRSAPFILALLLVPAVSGIAPATANAQNAAAPGFEGLWQAIDTHDGSTQLLSITCLRGGGCDVRLNDTAFTLSCPNQIGFAHGNGRIIRNVLSVELTLNCTEADGSSTVAGSQFNEFLLDHRAGTLTNLNDDPVPLPNVFHRISR